MVLTASTKIFDVSTNKTIEYNKTIPERSVVIPGTYNKKFKSGTFGVPCALIIGKEKKVLIKKHLSIML